jgi:hypothetical protein
MRQRQKTFHAGILLNKGAGSEIALRVQLCPYCALELSRFSCLRSHKPLFCLGYMAGTTGLEPATSAVTVNRKRVTVRKQG